MANMYFFRQEGVKHGPISGTGLQKLAAAGDLKPGDMVQVRGEEDWVAAASFAWLLFPGDARETSAPARTAFDDVCGLLPQLTVGERARVRTLLDQLDASPPVQPGAGPEGGCP
jgi:hypothetical protein